MRFLVMAFAMLAASAAMAQTPTSFPQMEITREGTTHEWPFAIDEGKLSCVAYAGQYHVFFSEPWPANSSVPTFPMTLPRSVVVTTNPMALFATFEDRALYAPFASLEELIRRLAPFEALGQRLCLDERQEK